MQYKIVKNLNNHVTLIKDEEEKDLIIFGYDAMILPFSMLSNVNQEIAVFVAGLKIKDPLMGLGEDSHSKGKLEKHIVKPILLELLKNSSEHRDRVVDSIQDINSYMNWHLGEKPLSD
ncbi:hypothetical protein [Enterococcus sp. AZ196]|uniref:hypothetical protein n=1 Tax=Enterococcus sp. AZ196 TaxID=2774659 RepID=UPI003D2B65B3